MSNFKLSTSGFTHHPRVTKVQKRWGRTIGGSWVSYMSGCSDSTNWFSLRWSFISFLNRRGANFTQGYQILGGTRFFMTPGLGLIGRGFDHAKWWLAVTNSIPCWSTCRMTALPNCCCYSVFCAKKSTSWKLLIYKTTLTPLPTFVPPFGLVICLWISASLNIRNSVCDYFYIPLHPKCSEWSAKFHSHYHTQHTHHTQGWQELQRQSNKY